MEVTGRERSNLDIPNFSVVDFFRAFEWMLNHGGIPTDQTYGTYKGIDANCHFNDSNVEMKFE